MRRLALALTLSTVSTAAFADAVTTRIETRPYYGAVVTVEQGVRVWRALPPHDRIIIVPENAKNVRVNIDAGSSNHAHAAAPPVINKSVTINNNGGGHGVVGVPFGISKPHHGGGHHGGAHHGGSHRGGYGIYGHKPRHH